MKLLNLLLTLFPAFSVTLGSTDCDDALKPIFEQLASTYKANDKPAVAAIPQICSSMTNQINNGSPALDRDSYTAFCTATEGKYVRYMTSYSYEKSINGTLAQLPAMEMAVALSYYFENPTDGITCQNGLTTMPDGSDNGNWDLWYEVISSTSPTCVPAVDPAEMQTSLTGALSMVAEWQKSSFCIVIEPPADTSNDSRIVIRGLHSSENEFDSPADIPCYVENPGYRVETEKC